MKKLGGFCAVLTAVFLASILFASCENWMMGGILGDKPAGEQPQFGSVDTSYSVLSRNMFMGGSLLYAADSPSSGHLAPGVKVAVRLGKVNYNPAAGAEGSANPGPMYAENIDSTRYGYITVETVDTNGIRLQYTEYTAGGKSSVSKGSYSVAAGEEKDINGDGIPDISYTPPSYTRSGFEQAVTLNFLSSPELDKLNTTMFAVLPEQYENKEYPSGIIGINPEGKFIAVKYTSTGARSLVRGIDTGDLIIDGVNHKYQRAVSSAGTYRSARSIADDDTEDIVDSPDLYFPLMSVDFSYELENVDPTVLQSRAVVAPTKTAYENEQEGINKIFYSYKYPVLETSISMGHVTGSLKLRVSGDKKNVWGTIEMTSSVVALVDAKLKEVTVRSRETEISLLTGSPSVSASLGGNLTFSAELDGKGINFLKDVNITVPIVPQLFWMDITPSIIFDYLLEVNVECDIPLRGGFTGLYGATMTIGANYGADFGGEWKRGWLGIPYWEPYIRAYLNPYVKGDPIKYTASYFELLNNPTAGSLTVSVGPSLTAAVEVRAAVGIDLVVAKASAGAYGSIGFNAKAPTTLKFIGSSVTLSKELKFGVYTNAGIDLRGEIAGVGKVSLAAETGNKPIFPPVTIPILPPVELTPPQVATPTASPASGAVLSGTAITLSTTTAGATIYYTTNGTTPTTASAQYTSPISITTATTIKAIAVKSGMTNSSVLTAAYTIIPLGTAKVIYTWVNENDQIVTSGGSTTLSRGAGQTLTISVTGSGYSDYQWSYNGSVVTGATTGSYTFNSAGKTNGVYNIDLRVKKGGAWYSTSIPITVTN